jgi:hypothetical protein
MERFGGTPQETVSGFFGGHFDGRWRRGTGDADGRHEAVTPAAYGDDISAVARVLVE